MGARLRKLALTIYRVSPLLYTFSITAANADETTGIGTLPDETQCEALQTTNPVLKGWCLAISEHKGDCLACHVVGTKREWPQTLLPGGDIAPPLVEMTARFPDKDLLRQRVWDATENNPQTSMPPYGRHKLLTEEEIDAVVDWLLTI